MKSQDPNIDSKSLRLVVECSPEQQDIIADHFLEDGEISMRKDERHWMLAQARKIHPNCKILKADLDVINGEWVLQIDPRA
jgi:hypothetical protein